MTRVITVTARFLAALMAWAYHQIGVDSWSLGLCLVFAASCSWEKFRDRLRDIYWPW